MDKAEILTKAACLAKKFPKDVNGADKADLFVYLAVELGLSHLLHPEASPDFDEPDLPAEAPELYQKRTESRERPHKFIRRVYGAWMGHGLAQHHLLQLDRALYFALHNWLLKNEKPDWLDLPSKKEINDRELEKLGLNDGDTLPYPCYYKGLKKKLSLYNAARNRQTKD